MATVRYRARNRDNKKAILNEETRGEILWQMGVECYIPKGRHENESELKTADE